ncbi:hypothetical protein [Propioniciclava sp.]|uniref:hypothetical protein n=1 Tax=Propioniciclava sp. TaxID=2038686 RepID=UPI00261BA8C1|nr:hypothetical protein [Propioniciclava sp.]
MVQRPVKPRTYAEYVADTLMGRLLRRDLAAVVTAWGGLLAVAGTVAALMGVGSGLFWVGVGVVVAGVALWAWRRFQRVLDREAVPVHTAGGHGVVKDPNRFGNVSLYFLLAAIVGGAVIAWPRLEPGSRPVAVVALVAMAAFVASVQIPAIRRERTKFAAVEAGLAAHPDLAAIYRQNLQHWDAGGTAPGRGQRRQAPRKRT